jgi:hypothetical protein
MQGHLALRRGLKLRPGGKRDHPRNLGWINAESEGRAQRQEEFPAHNVVRRAHGSRHPLQGETGDPCGTQLPDWPARADDVSV